MSHWIEGRAGRALICSGQEHWLRTDSQEEGKCLIYVEVWLV